MSETQLTALQDLLITHEIASERLVVRAASAEAERDALRREVDRLREVLEFFAKGFFVFTTCVEPAPPSIHQPKQRRPAVSDKPLIRNRPSEDGRQLGAKLAKWCDDAEPKARLKVPELPPRCASCAFRAGRHLANGSPTTQMDALKCAMEGVEFQCHEPSREGHACSGWLMMMLAKDDPSVTNAPWPFSDEALR